jgi:hypothetical protein
MIIVCRGTLKYSAYVNNLCSLQKLQDSIGREFAVLQGKIAIMFDRYFLKAQGLTNIF